MRDRRWDGPANGPARPSSLHRRVQRRLASLLESALPRGLRVDEEQVLVLGHEPPHARIPDVCVFRVGSGFSDLANTIEATAVVLAVEVVSRGSQQADRFEKPAEYAAAHIPSFWRIETEPDVVVWTFRLEDGVYREEGHFGRGCLVKDVILSWVVRIEVDDLARDVHVGL